MEIKTMDAAAAGEQPRRGPGGGRGVADPLPARALNRLQVMEALRERGPLSRVEIGERTGLAPATVSEVTAALLDEGLLRESRSVASGRGRPRVLLEVDAMAGRVMGLKLSTHRLTLSLTDFTGRAIDAESRPLLPDKLPIGEVAAQAAGHARAFLARHRLRPGGLAGIGVGLPGFVESGTGACRWSPLFGEDPPSFSDLLAERLGAPVVAENDVNLVAMAERWFGQGRGVDDFFVLTVEHGVGMGLYLGGRLYRGRGGMAAEFGHMLHAEGGPPCRCGRRGCVEAYVADYALAARAGNLADLPFPVDGEAVNRAIREATRLAEAGHPGIRALLAEAGRVLGLAAANVANILTPERVIVTGEGMRAGDLLMRPMMDAFHERVIAPLRGATPVVWHRWGDAVWAQGAAVLVIEERFAGRRPRGSARPRRAPPPPGRSRAA